MDIDEKEMIVRFRRKRIKGKLLKVSAKEIARHIFCLVRENCEGCITFHLSQTHVCPWECLNASSTLTRHCKELWKQR